MDECNKIENLENCIIWMDNSGRSAESVGSWQWNNSSTIECSRYFQPEQFGLDLDGFEQFGSCWRTFPEGESDFQFWSRGSSFPVGSMGTREKCFDYQPKVGTQSLWRRSIWRPPPGLLHYLQGYNQQSEQFFEIGTLLSSVQRTTCHSCCFGLWWN